VHDNSKRQEQTQRTDVSFRGLRPSAKKLEKRQRRTFAGVNSKLLCCIVRGHSVGVQSSPTHYNHRNIHEIAADPERGGEAVGGR